ncbi:AAA family ATPase [Saccharococcus caldoxylosilyticus]|uniref:AAA family ATPase n=1 Tax=Saccharococcus caldoxylosilyticus TaxID=81408 RepID=UPI00035C4414|nr:AAA family ATPase [Parageobacillus caldoxylosilyticus]
MGTSIEKTIYIISGPCGVGKSTVAKELSRNLKHAALISGDDIMFMIEKGYAPPWEEWLSITWKNILSLTRNFVQHDLNVVIDCVVESELEWFCQHISDLNIPIKYIVLIASEDKLIERLNKRGDDHLIDRSLFLLKKLGSSAGNKKYIYDTTHKQSSEIVHDLMHLSDFYVTEL